MRFFSLLLCLLAACGQFSSPKPALVLSGTQRAALADEYTGQEFVLAQSLILAPYFSEQGKWLASTAAPKHLDLRNGKLKPLTATETTGVIVPAGSQIRVESLELTDPSAITTPGAHAKLLIRSLEEDAPVKETLVVVLPHTVTDAGALKTAIGDMLTGPSFRDWLAQRTPEVLDAIFVKNAIVGMSRSELVAALGHPVKSDGASTFDNVADYGDFRITLMGGVVTEINVPAPEPEPEVVSEVVAPAEPTKEAGKLGLQVEAIKRRDRRKLGLKRKQKAVQVTTVMPGGAAQRAGIVTGDLILKIGTVAPTGPKDLVTAEQTSFAGESLMLEIFRNNEKQQIELQPLSTQAATQAAIAARAKQARTQTKATAAKGFPEPSTNGRSPVVAKPQSEKPEPIQPQAAAAPQPVKKSKDPKKKAERGSDDSAPNKFPTRSESSDAPKFPVRSQKK